MHTKMNVILSKQILQQRRRTLSLIVAALPSLPPLRIDSNSTCANTSPNTSPFRYSKLDLCKRKRGYSRTRIGNFSGLETRDENPTDSNYVGRPSTIPESLNVKKLRFENQLRVYGPEQAAIELNGILQFWLNTSIGKEPNARYSIDYQSVEDMLRWIESMDPHFQPNLSAYQTLLDGFLKNPGDMHTAETLLQRMTKLIAKNQVSDTIIEDVATPTTDTSPIDPLPQDSTPNDVTQTDALKQEESSPDELEVMSVLYSFNKVMTIYVNLDRIYDAEKLLRELERISYDNNIKLLSNETYNIVISGWAKHGKPREAEFNLYKMLNQQDTTLRRIGIKLMPRKEIFDSCLNSWVSYPTRNSGQRAELLVLKMQELHENGNDTKPTYKTYTKVLKAWLNSKHEHAYTRIDTILQTLERLDWSDDNDPYLMKVVVEAYGTAMKACSYVGLGKEPVEKCQEFLSRLETAIGGFHNIEFKDIPYLYASLVHAWSASKLANAATNIEKIFLEVDAKHKKLYIESPDKVDPCLPYTFFHAVLHGFSRTGSGHKAQTILSRMIQDYTDAYENKTDTTSLGKIDTKCFNCVLLAWSKSRDATASEQAEVWFHRTLQLKDSKKLNVRPDVVTYNAVISALSGSRDAQVAHRGYKYFRQMFNIPHCRPTRVTYTKAISLWTNVGTREALDIAQELLDEMISSGDRSILPDDTAYKTFLMVLKSSSNFLPPNEYKKRYTEVSHKMKGNSGNRNRR